MSECPSREQLALLLAEQLGESETGRVEAHLEKCPPCQGVLEGLCGSPLTLPHARRPRRTAGRTPGEAPHGLPVPRRAKEQEIAARRYSRV
jgi:hypothetical protein